MAVTGSWRRQPQAMWPRKALFQIHLWTGLATGLYVVVISLTGSVLVYRSELRQYFNPEPRTVAVTGTRFSADALVAATRERFPEADIEVWTEPDEPELAVTMSVEEPGGGGRDLLLFDPYTGEYLGNSLPVGWRLTTWTLDLHDNLLGGETGRTVNGIGAALLGVLSLTGMVIWWPGTEGWKRALLVDWRANWRRVNWSIHSAFGFWTLLFIGMWAFTGVYLAFPEPFTAVVDYLEPFEEDNFDPRTGDQILYWFSRLHFGRFGWATKVGWAAIGLVPPVMFVTGTIMWWNRVVRPWLAR
ncbi:MAG: PepSY-associated TM helix domain-containing protein [Acidobacteria bacterium]|nr:PepSY-associated TM helix domain-containing protein [Acidobacteriota bacterium]